METKDIQGTILLRFRYTKQNGCNHVLYLLQILIQYLNWNGNQGCNKLFLFGFLMALT